MIDYINEQWRELLYPLGFFSSIAFGLRMLIQWFNSERAKQSNVTPLFWQLSLCGNLTLILHAFIQIQFHVAIIQICNAVISWRNLNLMQKEGDRFSFKQTLFILLFSLGIGIAIFSLQSMTLINHPNPWFRVPINSWHSHVDSPVSLLWHFFGFLGLTLFSSRFWIQWWYAEKQGYSYFNQAFWWTSLCGESICLIYFLQIHDPVNYLGPLFGLIPCIRNLMFIYRKQEKVGVDEC